MNTQPLDDASWQSDPEASAVVLRLQPLETYRESRSHLFPSPESLRWMVRRHRAHLVDAGALRSPNGRWLIDPVRFDMVLLKLTSKRGRAETAAGVCTRNQPPGSGQDEAGGHV